MAQIPPSLARRKFLLCNQFHFSCRFIRLFTGSGLRLGNAARNNLAAVLDDFPIPVAIFAIGHNAEFNTVSHYRLGPSARNDDRGKSGHSLLCRTQSTRTREGPALGPKEKYQPLFPSSRRTACRPGLTTPHFACPSLLTLTTHRRAGRFRRRFPGIRHVNSASTVAHAPVSGHSLSTTARIKKESPGRKHRERDGWHICVRESEPSAPYASAKKEQVLKANRGDIFARGLGDFPA